MRRSATLLGVLLGGAALAQDVPPVPAIPSGVRAKITTGVREGVHARGGKERAADERTAVAQLEAATAATVNPALKEAVTIKLAGGTLNTTFPSEAERDKAIDRYARDVQFRVLDAKTCVAHGPQLDKLSAGGWGVLPASFVKVERVIDRHTVLVAVQSIDAGDGRVAWLPALVAGVDIRALPDPVRELPTATYYVSPSRDVGGRMLPVLVPYLPTPAELDRIIMK
jgi:hypothetical protein